jgi:cytochrome c-type biogenesis protein
LDIILAFSAGLLSFLSPCVLPLIPAYLSYIAGSTAAELNTNKAKANLMIRSVFFVIGFSIVFILLGVTVSSISKLFSANLSLFTKAGGILVFVFGLHMTGLIKIKALYSEKRFLPNGNINKKIGPLFLGMAFAAGWTPCVGPILSSILIYAGSMATVYKGVALLSVYSLGLAVPFLLSALMISNFSGYFKKFSKFLPMVSVVSGILMMIMGILIFTDRLTILSRYFSAFNL